MCCAITKRLSVQSCLSLDCSYDICVAARCRIRLPNYERQLQREREAREARQLDREIRAQERHLHAESKKKEAAELLKHQQFDKGAQQSHHRASESPSSSSTTSVTNKSTGRASIERAASTADGRARSASVDKDKLATTSDQSAAATTTTEFIHKVCVRAYLYVFSFITLARQYLVLQASN